MSHHASVDDRSDLPAQRLGDAVKLPLALAVLHDLALAAERARCAAEGCRPPLALDSAQRELAQQGPCSGSQGKLCHSRVALL